MLGRHPDALHVAPTIRHQTDGLVTCVGACSCVRACVRASERVGFHVDDANSSRTVLVYGD